MPFGHLLQLVRFLTYSLTFHVKKEGECAFTLLLVLSQQTEHQCGAAQLASSPEDRHNLSHRNRICKVAVTPFGREGSLLFRHTAKIVYGTDEPFHRWLQNWTLINNSSMCPRCLDKRRCT